MPPLNRNMSIFVHPCRPLEPNHSPLSNSLRSCNVGAYTFVECADGLLSVCVCVCVLACVHVCVRSCVCVCVCVLFGSTILNLQVHIKHVMQALACGAKDHVLA